MDYLDGQNNESPQFPIPNNAPLPGEESAPQEEKNTTPSLESKILQVGTSLIGPNSNQSTTENTNDRQINASKSVGGESADASIGSVFTKSIGNTSPSRLQAGNGNGNLDPNSTQNSQPLLLNQQPPAPVVVNLPPKISSDTEKLMTDFNTSKTPSMDKASTLTDLKVGPERAKKLGDKQEKYKAKEAKDNRNAKITKIAMASVFTSTIVLGIVSIFVPVLIPAFAASLFIAVPLAIVAPDMPIYAKYLGELADIHEENMNRETKSVIEKTINETKDPYKDFLSNNFEGIIAHIDEELEKLSEISDNSEEISKLKNSQRELIELDQYLIGNGHYTREPPSENQMNSP